jgi:hypothetical protein
MRGWTNDELTEVGSTEEIRIASLRADGTLRKPVTIWVVRHHDGLYVRSVGGRKAAWFRGTRTTHRGRIWAAGIEREVEFVDVDDDSWGERLDSAYRAKYRRYAARIVNSVLTPAARSATLKLVTG